MFLTRHQLVLVYVGHKKYAPTACEMRVMGCKGTGFGVAPTLCV